MADETFRVQCDACGFSCVVPAKYEGMKAKCPKCQAVFIIQAEAPPRQASFRCGACGLTRQVPTSLSGRKAKCPQCGTVGAIIATPVEMGEREPAVAPKATGASGPSQAPPDTAAKAGTAAAASTTDTASERRREERVPVKGLEMSMGPVMGEYPLVNLNIGGLAFNTTTCEMDLAPGRVLLFDILENDKVVLRGLKGKVAHHCSSQAGVAFVTMDDAQRGVLEGLVTRQRYAAYLKEPEETINFELDERALAVKLRGFL